MRALPLSTRASALLLAVLAAACSTEVPEQASVALPPDHVTLTPEQVQRARIVTRRVQVSDLDGSIEIPGTLQPADTSLAMVGSIVEGRVERVLVIPGSRVEEGQPLAYLHAHELQTALRDLAVAESRFAYAEAAFERADTLLKAGAISRQEEHMRRVEVEAAVAEMERAEHVVEILSPTPTGEMTVLAPRAGVVLEVHTHPGAAVTPGSPLFVVGTVDPLWATGFVPEGLAGRMGEGVEASVHVGALDGLVIPARVIQLGSQIDPLRRAVEVRVELDEVPAGVRPGMFVTVSLAIPSLGPSIRVPEAAVQALDGQEVVFIETAPGEFHFLPVEVTLEPGGTALIRGVQDDALLVVEGAYFLRAELELRLTGPGEGGPE